MVDKSIIAPDRYTPGPTPIGTKEMPMFLEYELRKIAAGMALGAAVDEDADYNWTGQHHWDVGDSMAATPVPNIPLTIEGAFGLFTFNPGDENFVDLLRVVGQWYFDPPPVGLPTPQTGTLMSFGVTFDNGFPQLQLG
ncbi:unnamed protein product, partial [marine sediment metagenome]